MQSGGVFTAIICFTTVLFVQVRIVLIFYYYH